MTRAVCQSVYYVITHQTAQKPRMKVVVRMRHFSQTIVLLSVFIKTFYGPASVSIVSLNCEMLNNIRTTDFHHFVHRP